VHATLGQQVTTSNTHPQNEPILLLLLLRNVWATATTAGTAFKLGSVKAWVTLNVKPNFLLEFAIADWSTTLDLGSTADQL
jgi:hypothetical protein